MTVGDPAEQLLHDLGITEPNEIDLEVIAYMVGASVRLRSLGRGDARIVGLGDRAIITIDADASSVRQRFSVAHELGHWHHHRGQRLICQDADPTEPAATAGAEREADRYAASLLMPRFLVGPMIAGLPMKMALVDEVADRFRVSTIAAILRMTDLHTDAFAIVVEEPVGRRWFRRSVGLDQRWFVWTAGPAGARSSEVDPCRAIHWFRGPDLANRRVSIETRRSADGQVIRLIHGPIQRVDA
ncbi:ImmA/IrrE family metallo-endopeptidase [Sphingomonas sp. TX0543]|uniref:ImmA/IrrE family metallo-endopeptidase n=1 Tax=unclassified Sphingomonas TaxID=196159 RepID=UPI0010F82428|nr:ImmA/IrrE family metallo-endopeptidase [Sphingomonas sp. 3P27F8]